MARGKDFWLGLVIGCFLIPSVGWADDLQGTASSGSETESEQTRLGFLLQRADALSIRLAGPASEKDDDAGRAKRIAAPALRYQNPLFEAQSDGVLLIWEIDSVPAVFASYSIRKEEVVFRELATSSDRQLVCTLDDQVVWSPLPPFERRRLDSAPAVPKQAALRLRVMKRLTQRFKSGNKRILTTPVHRYQSEARGVIDGAAFVMTDTNDPEMLVLIEAAKDSETDLEFWRYTLVRMNSFPQQVQLDGELVWDLPGYWANPKKVTDPYREQLDSALPVDLRLSE